MNEEIKAVAKAEKIDEAKLRRLFSAGRVVIPKNVKRGGMHVRGIGECLRIKINANVGTSKDYVDINEEIEKAKTAERLGSDAVMDLSTGGDIDAIRRKILSSVKIPVGTVPIYQAVIEKGGAADLSSDDFFNVIRKHAKDGVDFVTVHAGVNLNSLERLKKSKRILNVVSRGGCFTIAWMLKNGKENPYYEEYDYLLEIAKEYNLTLSLGDGMRPGCIADASDRAKFMEFITLGELVSRAREKKVQAIVEGPGHVPINEVGLSVQAMKHLTEYAPLYLLGPLVTDVAPGYDHITGAIGGAVAGAYGADFLCIVTPSEHLALPTVEDIKEGVIVARIAAHAADIVRLGEDARKWDREMAIARKNLDWEKQFSLALDAEKARKIKKSRESPTDACSMCSDLCAIKMVREALE
jgi:phosphomethylpyrimidine synthase